MAEDKGKSGSPVNPFEEMSFTNEKKEKVEKKSGKKEMWSKIEKGVSESKRDNLKGDIGGEEEKSSKKRRRRPRRKTKSLESLDVKQENNKVEPAPVNPFVEMAKQQPISTSEEPSVQQDDSATPETPLATPETPPATPETSPVVPETPPEPDPFVAPNKVEELPPTGYEDRYVDDNDVEKVKEEESQDFVENESIDVVDNVVGGDSDPINPFAPAPSDSSVADVKALGDKPLDQRADGVDTSIKNESNKDEPEEIHHSDEHMTQEGESGFSESGDTASESVDLATGKVSEVVEVEPGEMSPDASVIEPTETQINEESSNISEVEEFKEEFWDILEQAGFTKKRLITIVVVFVVGVFALIGWGSGWFNFSSSENGDVETVEVEKIFEDEKDVQEVVEENFESTVVESSYVVEEQSVSLEMIESNNALYNGAFAGVEVAFMLGGIDYSFEEQIVYYVELIRRMESMYATEVYALIDRAVDRRAALSKHLEQMDALIKEGNSAYNSIVAAMNRFDAEFEVTANNKFVYEEQFFSNVSALLPSSSYNSFETFVELSKEGVELKAYFNSYKLLRDMLANSLNALEPRYRDINSNIEALIKGIRVFDVPWSDIEAIIPI